MSFVLASVSQASQYVICEIDIQQIPTSSGASASDFCSFASSLLSDQGQMANVWKDHRGLERSYVSLVAGLWGKA